jgi:hypothetical protein
MSTNQMKALVKVRPEVGLWMENVPVPEPGDSDVLIKVKKSAICGTDVHIWKWDEWSAKTVPVPMVVGHEFCGEIVDCGRAATKYRIGQRVSIMLCRILESHGKQLPSIWMNLLAKDLLRRFRQAGTTILSTQSWWLCFWTLRSVTLEGLLVGLRQLRGFWDWRAYYDICTSSLRA